MRVRQFEFRSGRSATAAISATHTQWHRAVQKGHAVGIMGFDLSSAFDTIDPAVLLPKLRKLGITGSTLQWFKNYMEGGRQEVNWAGTLSGFVQVKFGVRQGSILVIMADLPEALSLTEEWIVGYADDVALWASDKNPEVVRKNSPSMQ